MLVAVGIPLDQASDEVHRLLADRPRPGVQPQPAQALNDFTFLTRAYVEAPRRTLDPHDLALAGKYADRYRKVPDMPRGCSECNNRNRLTARHQILYRSPWRDVDTYRFVRYKHCSIARH